MSPRSKPNGQVLPVGINSRCPAEAAITPRKETVYPGMRVPGMGVFLQTTPTPCGRCQHFSDDACDPDLLGGDGICLAEHGPRVVTRQTDVGCCYYQDVLEKQPIAEAVHGDHLATKNNAKLIPGGGTGPGKKIRKR